MSGAELIQQERQRQIESEHWTPEHDDMHTNQSIVIAAVCYALPDSMREYQSYVAEYADNGGRDLIGFIPKLWPWDRDFWKPSDDRIKELKKAGALLAAEIDRLQRAPVAQKEQE